MLFVVVNYIVTRKTKTIDRSGVQRFRVLYILHQYRSHLRPDIVFYCTVSYVGMTASCHKEKGVGRPLQATLRARTKQPCTRQELQRRLPSLLPRRLFTQTHWKKTMSALPCHHPTTTTLPYPTKTKILNSSQSSPWRPRLWSAAPTQTTFEILGGL